jgi:Skp family chaperone for outer membrane proteins
MKKFSAIALAVGLLGMTAAAQAQRIAVVDIKKVFDAYTGTAAAKATLKQKVDDEKGELEREKDALDKEASDLQGQKSVLSDVAKRDKYDLVFEASNLLYGGDDITASAIEEVNNQ